MRKTFLFDAETDEILSRSLIRLKYLYPKAEIKLENKAIIFEGEENLETINQEVHKVVYSEKIYLETLDIRKKIFNDL